jgi:uroporphyrinogen-III decarboxylase
VVWGSSIFYAIYDQPELVHDLLEIVTQTYIRCMRAWLKVVPFREGYNAHWGLLHKGNIMLRDDSAMNLSPDMFDTFIRPYDQRLLDEFGGGAIHFCGKGDHYIERLSQMKGVYAIHMSQPEYNDMETMYSHTVDKGINVLGLRGEVAAESLAQGRALHGRVHAVREQSAALS